MIKTYNRAANADEDLVQAKKNDTKNSLGVSKDLVLGYMKILNDDKAPPESFKDILTTTNELKKK